MRYRLRTLLIVVTAIGVLLGVVVDKVRTTRQRRTQRMLSRLATEAEMQARANSELPPDGIDALVKQLNSTGSHLPPWFLERRIAYPGIEQGIDSWGHPLIVEALDDGLVSIRSVGANGIDENGKGDDIQRSINCRAFLDSPATSKKWADAPRLIPPSYRGGRNGGGGAIRPLPSNETAKSIEGAYVLYPWEDRDGKLTRKMVITARTEKEFSIRGLDEAWSGEGRIDGNNGYYHWVFVTGEIGTTTFTINSDGTLKGEVRGGIEPWTYLARRSKEDDGESLSPDPTNADGIAKP